MKFFLIVLSMLFSMGVFAGDFEATVTKDMLVINVNDSFVPPFEAGELWSSMKDAGIRKFIDTEHFFMGCRAIKDPSGEAIGDCTIMISMSKIQKIGEKLVYKLTGAQAAYLNQYFVDSAYVSIQRGKVHLSSYNTRRQFFFGIDEDLVKK